MVGAVAKPASGRAHRLARGVRRFSPSLSPLSVSTVSGRSTLALHWSPAVVAGEQSREGAGWTEGMSGLGEGTRGVSRLGMSGRG